MIALTDEIRAREGDWVEVECKLLDPADRSKPLPPETAEKPLLMWVKGFAQAAAVVGEELTIETITGRRVSGRLRAVNPGYYHHVRAPVPSSRSRSWRTWRRAQDLPGAAGGLTTPEGAAGAAPAGGER